MCPWTLFVTRNSIFPRKSFAFRNKEHVFEESGSFCFYTLYACLYLGMCWYIKINNNIHMWNVQAPASHICGDQN